MTDLFSDIVSKFLSPLSGLEMGVIDALYFLRDDDVFVFTEGYLHPPGQLMGKAMLYPSPEGEVDIFGRRYASSYKRVVEGKTELIPHEEQLKLQFKITPSLDPARPRPVHEEYHVRFPLDRFRGVFEHRHSLRRAMEMHPGIRKAIEEIGRDFDLPLSRLGCTGSACYGKFEEPEEDIDLVFYGSLEENRRVLDRIREITRIPENRVVEFGKLWPIRFFWKKMMICSFFNYRLAEEIPLRDVRITPLAEVSGEGTVADDTHSIYMPSILGLEDLNLEGESRPGMELIIYDGSLRGEYYRGDRLWFRARRVRVEGAAWDREALLVTLSDNIGKAR